MWLDGTRIRRKRWPLELERLVQASVRDRRAGTPPLSATTVRYAREPHRRERWQSAEDTYLRGEGDCEDLAVYLAGDLRFAGIPALVVIKPVRPGLRHAQVMARVNGRLVLLDPSRVRGMKGAG